MRIVTMPMLGKLAKTSLSVAAETYCPLFVMHVPVQTCVRFSESKQREREDGGTRRLSARARVRRRLN